MATQCQGPLVGSWSRGWEEGGPCLVENGHYTKLDFTRKVPWSGLSKPGSRAGGCRVTGQELDVSEPLTSGWRLKSQQSAQKRGNGFPQMFVD